MMKRISFVILAAGLLAGLSAAPAPARVPANTPRLAVVISVDQMRGDYLERFRPYFGPDGFNRLLRRGAWFQNCHYLHAITKTAPGHATILSGVHANVHAIIGNEWLDRDTFIQGNAVEDAGSPLVGLPPAAGRSPGGVLEAKAGRSPRNYLGVTVGDCLKERYGAAAKVFGVADKDRAAILLAGRKADGAYWTEEGNFVTSTFYRSALPGWVTAFNARNFPAKHFGQVWERQLAPAVYERVQGADNAPGEQVEDGLPVTFPKRIDGGRPTLGSAFFNAFDHTPWDNEWVADMASELIDREQLGRDEIPDLLGIGFSQPDKCGHAYGPDSHEVMDTYLRLDRTLAKLFRFLDRRVGAGRYVVVLTADHGVAPLPETVKRQRGESAASRLDVAQLDRFVTAGLRLAYGELPEPLYWVVRDGSGYHFNPAALVAKQLPAAVAEEKLRAILASHDQIATAYTRTQLTDPAVLDPLGEMLRLSFFPDRSPDVLYITKEFVVERTPAGATHGTPYEYDTHVPQVWFGARVTPGVHPERVAVEDIAPTLAGLLGVKLPAEARGQRLF